MRRPTLEIRAIEHLKNLFLESPGTQLSLDSASRLAGLEREICRAVLEALEMAQFLARGRNGLFVRRGPDSPMD